MRLLEYEMQVGREARVRELSCPVVVVDKVDSAGGGVPDLPARRQRTELLAVHIAQVSEQRHGDHQHCSDTSVIIQNIYTVYVAQH